MNWRRLSQFKMLLARLVLALSLAAPHAGHAGLHRASDGLTVVICGAEGAYEMTLDSGAPPAPGAVHDPCCLMGCAGPPPAAAPETQSWARPCVRPPTAAPPHDAVTPGVCNARDPPMTR